MDFFYKTIGKGKPLFILHGLFGSSDNWMALGKIFAEGYHVVLVDLRNHGRSLQSDCWDYPIMADDIYQLAVKLGFNNINLIGHSMGGKVGMTIAEKFPDFLSKLVVVDIAPKYYPSRHQKIIDGLLNINLRQIKGHHEADMELADFVPERNVRQFLLKNLARDPGGGWKWKINLTFINNHLENIGASTIPSNTITIPVLFFRGVNSSYVTDEDVVKISKHYSNASVESIENAGHWLHVEKPEVFTKAAFEFLGE